MIENPEISIDYTMTFAEYQSGAKLGMRQAPLIFMVYFFSRYIASSLALLSFALVLFSVFHGDYGTARGILLIPLCLCIMPLVFTLQWKIGFNRLRKEKTGAPSLHFEANTEKFARRIEGMGDLIWFWSATQGFASNKSVILIAARKGAYIFIPRRFLTEQQIARLKELQQKGGQ